MRLSLVVGLYNMSREIPRTLHTMSSVVQGLAPDEYEIILVDNGSTVPLDEQKLKSISPNVRYVYVDDAPPSPTGGINHAVETSQGEYVTVVIDGARMFSPGVLSRTLQACQLFEDPFVYVPSLHLGPQLQNDSSYGGYEQSVEDELLQTIDWRTDGYQLFEVSNIEAVPERAMLPTFESNCFTVRRTTWDRVGGYHGGFANSVGGGLANWELFARYVGDAAIDPVLLVGEATFHQFHGGASTNQPRKGHPIHTWLNEHIEIFGRPYAWPVYEPVLFGQPRKPLLKSLYERNVHSRIALSQEFADAGDHESSIAIARLLVQYFPHDPARLQFLAAALERANRRAEALAIINEALTIAPNQAELYVTQGIINVGLGRFEDAHASYDAAIHQDRLLAEGYFHRGHLMRRELRYAEAIQDFEQAIESEPNPPPHYHRDLSEAQENLANVNQDADHPELPEPGLPESGLPESGLAGGHAAAEIRRVFLASVNGAYGPEISEPEIFEHGGHGSFSIPDLVALQSIVEDAGPTLALIIGGYLGLSTMAIVAATESHGSTIVSVDPNVRHRVFDAPLNHARSLVQSDRVQFVDGFFGARTDGGTRYDLTYFEPSYDEADIESTIASVPVVVPPGPFDFVLVDGEAGSEFDLTVALLPALTDDATVVFAGLHHQRLGDLLAHGARGTVEQMPVEGGAGFVVVRFSPIESRAVGSD